MARFSGGWIRIDRRLADEAIGSHHFALAIWIKLLLWATHYETKIIWNGEERTIPPGTVVTGISEISGGTHISKTTVYRWLQFLEKRNSIRIESGTRGSLITICNYSKYQLEHKEDGTQVERNVENQRKTDGTPAENGRTLIEQEYNLTKKQRNKKNTYGGIHVVEYPQEFEKVWVKYGRRGDKKAALEAWKKLNLSEVEVAMLHRSIDRYIQNNPEPRFRKHLCRYLTTDWREVEPVLETSNGKASWMQDLDFETDPRNERKAANG